jgi:hypothetical protein
MNINIESQAVGDMLKQMAKEKGKTPDEEAEDILRTVFLWWSDGKIVARKEDMAVMSGTLEAQEAKSDPN